MQTLAVRCSGTRQVRYSPPHHTRYAEYVSQAQQYISPLRHQIKSGQVDLAPHTSRGGRATARQAQAELSRRRSGKQQGRAEERGGRGGAQGGCRRPRRAAAAQTPSARRCPQSESRPPIPTRARRTIPSRVSSGRARWAVAEAAVGAYLPCVLVPPVHNPQVGAAHRAKSSGTLQQ